LFIIVVKVTKAGEWLSEFDMRAIAIGAALAVWMGVTAPAGVAATLTDGESGAENPAAGLFSTDVRNTPDRPTLEYRDEDQGGPITFDPNAFIGPEEALENGVVEAIGATKFEGGPPLKTVDPDRTYSLNRAAEILGIVPDAFAGLAGSSGELGSPLDGVGAPLDGYDGPLDGLAPYGADAGPANLADPVAGYGDYRNYDQHDEARDRRIRQAAGGIRQARGPVPRNALMVDLDVSAAQVKKIANVVPGSGERSSRPKEVGKPEEVFSVLERLQNLFKSVASVELSGGVAVFLSLLGVALLGLVCFAGWRRLRGAAA
jgi:hypothetical protein